MPGLVERYGAEECYASIFRFSAAVLRWLAEHRVDGRRSIAGYDGRLWAPFLPIHVDAHPPTATLADALALERRVYELLTRRWHAPPEAVHTHFSGAKRFHLLVDTRAFGRVNVGDVAPVPALVAQFQRARRAEEALCAARLALWRGDLAPGTRNNAAIRLASAFPAAGFDRDETLALLRTWATRQSRPLPPAELASVVASAYARPYPYTYGCRDEVIRGFCPYAERLAECADHREQHPRSGRDGGAPARGSV